MNIDGLGASILGGTSSTGGSSSQSLGQDDFLKLMLTQFSNQDPLKPLDNQQFLGQLAQFSVVSGVQSLNQSFAGLSGLIGADQALQASSLVGRDVLVNSDSLVLGDTGAQGGFDLPASSAGVQVEILDINGERIRLIPLGSQPAGVGVFEWDGLDDAGQAVEPGLYHMNITAEQAGQSVAVTSLARANVESIHLGGAQGPLLDLSGLGQAQIGWIRQLY
tara:strand:+ start:552 stop:1211 length:660 start_codon:yes stop_codon:yes gene_type:complete